MNIPDSLEYSENIAEAVAAAGGAVDNDIDDEDDIDSLKLKVSS